MYIFSLNIVRKRGVDEYGRVYNAPEIDSSEFLYIIMFIDVGKIEKYFFPENFNDQYKFENLIFIYLPSYLYKNI